MGILSGILGKPHELTNFFTSVPDPSGSHPWLPNLLVMSQVYLLLRPVSETGSACVLFHQPVRCSCSTFTWNKLEHINLLWSIVFNIVANLAPCTNAHTYSALVVHMSSYHRMYTALACARSSHYLVTANNPAALTSSSWYLVFSHQPRDSPRTVPV